MKKNVSEDYKNEIEKLEDQIEKLNATKHMYNTYKDAHSDRKYDQSQTYDKIKLDIINYNLAQTSKENGDTDIPTKYQNPKKFLD